MFSARILCASTALINSTAAESRLTLRSLDVTRIPNDLRIQLSAVIDSGITCTRFASFKYQRDGRSRSGAGCKCAKHNVEHLSSVILSKRFPIIAVRYKLPALRLFKVSTLT